ncbi:MAG: hypothetical protein IIY98_03365, partial [Aeriscardovia sp.]|nr:hypothetical protein [Aeriscardovia sp.]
PLPIVISNLSSLPVSRLQKPSRSLTAKSAKHFSGATVETRSSPLHAYRMGEAKSGEDRDASPLSRASTQSFLFVGAQMAKDPGRRTAYSPQR